MTKEETLALLKRYNDLKAKKDGSHLTQWQGVTHYMGQAYDGWNADEEPKLEKYKITDLTAQNSSEMLAEGLAGHAFSNRIAWFDLGLESVGDEAKNEAGKSIDAETVRRILAPVKWQMYRNFQVSHFYDEAHLFIRETADFATGIMYMYYDRKKNKPVFKTLHPRDVELIQDSAGEITGIYRAFQLTRREAADFFGENNLPEAMKDTAEKKAGQDIGSDKKWKFVQLIDLATNYDFDVPGEGEYVSVYLFDGEERPILEEKMERKPFAVWRWQRQVGGSAWGVDSPGMRCLPVVKFLNLLVEDQITLAELAAKGRNKKTKGLQVNWQAGGVTELDEGQDFGTVQFTGNLAWIQATLDYFRSVVQSTYKTDVFLILSRNLDRTKTAAEVEGLEDEKGALMAAFFSRLGDEFLEPVIEWMYNETLVHNLPVDMDPAELEELVGLDIKIDFVSPAYKAQEKNYRLAPTITWLSQVFSMVEAHPEVLDRVNFDRVVEVMHDVLGADPDTLLPKNKADQTRQNRAAGEAAAVKQLNDQQAFDNSIEAVKALGGKR